jgi:hypothetical protein
LGTFSTVFFVKSLKPFLEKYPFLNKKTDMTTRFRVRNVDLHLKNVVFKAINVGLYPIGTEYSLDSVNSETEIHIGTIGADLFQNKVLIIDYKLSRLAITETLPAEYQNVSFEFFRNDRGLIKIPFLINQNKEYLLFDTGASYFGLATTKQNALAIGGAEIVDSLKVQSWDIWVSFYGLEIIAPVMFGNKNLESSIVYYTEGVGFDDYYKSENMWGLTGNGYFLNDVIIIDFRKNRFGVN